jgi:hypothetical protein
LTAVGPPGYLRRMDGRSATLAAVAVAAIGIVTFFLLDGVAAAVAVIAAGVLLVVIGIVGWRDRAPASALASTGSSAIAGVDPVVYLPAEPVSNGQRRDALRDDAEAVADPLGRGETDPVLDREPRGDDAPERDYAPAPEPTTQVVADGTTVDHVHDEPLLGHSDLAAHVRDYHEDLAEVGSTIQLRLLHQRAHGAPHEPPVNLKTS